MDGGGGESKVRVVRCPNCQKLLPELADISLYRCGGCGATLQAKGPPPKLEPSSDKPDGPKVEYLELSERTSESKPMVLDASLGLDLGGNTDGLGRHEEIALSTTTTTTTASTTTRKENCSGVDDLIEKNEREQYGSNGLYQPMLSVDSISNNGKAVVETILHEGEETEQLVDKSLYAQQALVQNAKNVWNPKAFRKGVQLDSYSDEGPSNYYQNARGRFPNGDFDKKKNLEPDQAEMLRMLDELRDQLQRTCEVTDKQKMSIMVDRSTTSCSSYTHHARANRFPNGSFSLNRSPSGRTPRELEHNASRLVSLANAPSQSSMTGYGDPLVHRKAPFHLAVEYPLRPVNNSNGQLDHHRANFYNQNVHYHQAACLCLHCNGRHFSGAARGHSTTLSHQVSYFTDNCELPHIAAPLILGSRSCNSRSRSIPSNPHEPRVHRKATISKNYGRLCHSFTGGAPFVICNYCFELLELPGKSLALNKKTNKLRCGACFKLISVYCDGSKLVASALALVSPVSPKDNGFAGYNPCNSDQHTDERLVLPCVVTSSDHEMIERAHGLKNTDEFDDMKGISSTSAMSEHANSSDNVISEKGVPNYADIPVGPQIISRTPSLPIHADQTIDGWGSGNCSKRSEQEKNTILSGNFRQNSLKDVSMATKMDLLVNEFPDVTSSRDDTALIIKHNIQPRTAKAGDSFLGSIKKSFRFHKSMTRDRSKVTVNGYPIPDRLVKKAEKQAGTIYPGDYWYDYRAGFWGVMGHPCQGIIPPFIEEFNYPMAKNCAGGNTGILVNGRELCQKDLDLLVGRGFSTATGSYMLDISGRVWDESSSEELDSIGKLAPTIEKMKHGFGMRVLRTFAK
ncbi:uncharacterized protein LOC122041187 [Zingiber officinale]|uniref:uncharacterized protein LOC122041187 n=1 Tax=Zingiber officinale TaxID=94328 RepID=UPI001C4BFFC2|nr:uncharacterized protein LOC122041187 [Zingiber officinale]